MCVAHEALNAGRVCATKEEAKTTVRAHAVALDVEGKLTQVFPGVAEVVAHVEPEDHG